MQINDMSNFVNTLNKIDRLLGIGDKFGKGKKESAGVKNEDDRFEPNPQPTDATYSNPTYDINNLAIQQLMTEHEDIQDSVFELVKGLLERQGYTEEQLQSGEVEDVTVDELAQKKAAELVGPGGLLSPEKVSERIVQFSIAVVGGDKGKIDLIRSSIDRGFDEAEQLLGGLQDISKDTYKLIQEKLDAWMNEGKEGEITENAEETVQES